MSVRYAIVPAAGLAKRMRPLTTAIPKEMLPLGRKPVIQHVVEELDAAGIDHTVLVGRPGKEAIEKHFDARPANRQVATPGVYFVHQQEQLGLGHAVLQGREAVGDHPFAVANGDSLIFCKEEPLMARMVRLFEERNAAAVIALERVAPERVHRYGIVVPGRIANGVIEIRGLVEKPQPERAPSNLAIAARYVFSPEIFPMLAQTPPGANGEIQLTDAITRLSEDDRPVYGVLLRPGERRYDIGGFDSFSRAFIDFALADPDFGEALRAELRRRLE